MRYERIMKLKTTKLEIMYDLYVSTKSKSFLERWKKEIYKEVDYEYKNKC